MSSKLTPEAREAIALYVSGGVTIPHASEAAGYSWNTVKGWLKQGKTGREPYAGFVDAMNRAKSVWAARATIEITRAGKKDWKALAWMLERRYPSEWAPPARVELTGRDGGPVETAIRYVIQVPQEEPEE